MVYYVLVLLLALWAVGLSFGIGGGFVHLLLLAGSLLLALELLQRARYTREPS